MNTRQVKDTTTPKTESERSFAAASVERCIRLTKDRRSEEKTLSDLAALKEKPEREFELPVPLRPVKEITQVHEVGQMKVFAVAPQGEDAAEALQASRPVVLYIHGGAYLHEASMLHWQAIRKLATRADATFVVPAYPLAPWHSANEAYALIEDLYRWLTMDLGKRVTLMGDSAGGGFALGLAQCVATAELPAARALVLLSPWVDASMENPECAAYEEVDPMLTCGSLRGSARCWANGTDTHDWHISPINGKLSDLPPTTMLVGTRELFYPDDTLLYEKLIAAGNDATLIIGEDMNHVWPIYPIPEADAALDAIAAAVLAIRQR